MPRPDGPPSGDHAVVVVVDDWDGTFHIPDGAEHRFEAGPRWLAPVGGLVAVVLAIGVLQLPVAPEVVWLAALVIFLAAAGAVALNPGGPRGATAAIVAATIAWASLAAAVLTQADVAEPWVAALVAMGVVAPVVFVERLRAQRMEDRDVVKAARGGARSEGWVVAVSGLPWDADVRVEPSDGNGGPWTGSHADWRAVRPGVGHPVGIWRPDRMGAVVLLPRTPR